MSRTVDSTTLSEDGDEEDCATKQFDTAPECLALVLVWSKDEPWRVGQVLLLPRADEPIWIGRGENVSGRPAKAAFGEQRPGSWVESPALVSPALSRYQLSLHSVEDGCLARNEGKRALLRNGVETRECLIEPGDVLQLGKQLSFLCCRRPMSFAGDAEYPRFPFGHADPHGIVGESPATWMLRQRLLFVAARPDHVMLRGESGAGKDLVANAIHALSAAPSRMVSRNAATLPDALIDAELFGNTKNYPNPGMAERPGLVGEAHGGTLFLDEFAELSHAMQAHLLSVLDRGEYQRLGDARARVSHFRLIAATNRSFSSLKQDLLARLTFRITVPDLNARLEDVPLLVRHILRRLAERGDAAALRLFTGGDPSAEPRVPQEWMTGLLRRRYTTNVRELQALVWEGLLLPDEPHDEEGESRAPGEGLDASTAGASRGTAEGATSPARIQQCLDANNGSLEHTWRALGLSSRFALMRLIKKHGLEVRRRSAPPKSAT